MQNLNYYSYLEINLETREMTRRFPGSRILHVMVMKKLIHLS